MEVVYPPFRDLLVNKCNAQMWTIVHETRQGENATQACENHIKYKKTKTQKQF